MANGKIELQVSADDDDVAYVSLRGNPGEVAGSVKRTVELSTLIPSYKGPLVVLDFDDTDTLIGIEIVGA